VTKAARLLRELLAISSPTGFEVDLAVYLETRFAGCGFRTVRIPVDAARFNLLVTTDQAPTVLLSTHMDTVSPDLPVSISETLIKGRGACDAKGCIAAMAEAALRLYTEGERRFGLLFVVGEETHSDGAKAAARHDLGSRFVVIGEPTENRLAVGQKGILLFRLFVEGVAGHSAYPEQGRSAVHGLIEVLSDWLKVDWGTDPLFGLTTLNVGTAQGGAGANVIAGSAEASGIFRISTSAQAVLDEVERRLPAYARLEVTSLCDPLRLKTVPGFEEIVVSFGSDAPHLRPLGEVLMIGPGSIRYAHSDHEQISCSELEEGVTQYQNSVKALLAGG